MAVLEHVVLQAAGPELPDASVVPMLRLGAWARAFEAHAANPVIADDELARLVERFARLDPPRQPGGEAFGFAHAALRRAPLGNALEPLWSIQLSSALHAMVWDLRGELSSLARRDGRATLDSYLERAADGVCVALFVTSAAMLIGERGALAAIAPLTEVERHASVEVLLARDLAMWTALPSPRNAVAIAGADVVRARLASVAAALDASLAALARSAPETAGFARRFTEAYVAMAMAPEVKAA